MAGGRPTIYTPELASYVCEMIATHACGLKKLTKMYEDFPHSSSVYTWLYRYPEFMSQYLTARQAQASVLADSMLDIEEETPTFEDKDGIERVDAGMLGKSKLRYEILKWHASKMAPKIFGDKQQVDISANETTKEVVKRVADINKEAEKEY